MPVNDCWHAFLLAADTLHPQDISASFPGVKNASSSKPISNPDEVNTGKTVNVNLPFKKEPIVPSFDISIPVSNGFFGTFRC